MSKLKKFFFKITDYDIFSEMSLDEKLKYLFWRLLGLEFLLFMLIFSLSFNRVRADENPYFSVPASSCTNYSSDSSVRLYINNDSDYVLRSVIVKRSNSNLYDFYIVSEYAFDYANGASACESSLSSATLVSNYYFSSLYTVSSVPSYWLIPVHDQLENFTSRETAIYYTFGDGSFTIDYAPVRRIYPHDNNRIISGFSHRVNQLNAQKSNNLVLYFTRYIKNSDALVSYLFCWAPVDSSSAGIVSNLNHFSYTTDSSGNLTIVFNNNLFVDYGITSIYCTSLFAGYSETDLLSEPSEYLDVSNWNTYSTLYEDPLNQFHGAFLGVSSLASNQFVYSDFSIPQNLTLYKTSADYTNKQLSTPLYFYVSVNETVDYYDYYVLLSLADDTTLNPDLLNVYNARQTSDGQSLTYYSVINYVGYLPVYVGTDLEGVNDPTDFLNGDLSNSIDGVGGPGDYPTESEYENMTIFSILGDVFSTTTDLLTSEFDEFSRILNQIENYQNYYSVALNSFNNSTLLSNATWINDQIDWFYNNTAFQVVANISLAGLVVFSVIF